MHGMEQGFHRHWSLACLIALLLGACASTGPAPVEDLSGTHTPRSEHARVIPARAQGAGSHRVERGDTLYSIAFRNGLDYRELAAWNDIGPPYTIHVGQELRLRAPVAPRTSAGPAAGAVQRGPSPLASTPANKPSATPAPFGAPERTPPAGTPTAAPAAAGTATPPSPVAAAPAPKSEAETITPSVPAGERPASAGEVSWRWPAGGTLSGAFVSGDPTRQGIDISGKAGDPVRAAADGTVVYSGNGLIGYGELIIIKHNTSYLSAYGHNRKRMVSEGASVKAGQVIAEMGSSNASRDALHFEIRKNGKPVNPLDYLPRR